MLSRHCKKGKCEDENITDSPVWEEEFAFTDNVGIPVCLLCHASLNHHKTSNLKHHYEAKYKNFATNYPHLSDFRRNKLTELKIFIKLTAGSVENF